MLLNKLYASLTILLTLWPCSAPWTLEIPVTPVFSMATAFNRSMDFLTITNKCDLEEPSPLLPCIKDDDPPLDCSRFYPPPPPLPPRLLACEPALTPDCNVTIVDGGDDGGDAGKIIEAINTSLGVLLVVVSVFGVLLVSSVVGFLLKRKNRARIAPLICCQTPVASRPGAAPPNQAPGRAVRASPDRAAPQPAPQSASPPAPESASPPAPPVVHAKKTSIVEMVKLKYAEANWTANCWNSSATETNNNNVKYYDNRAAELDKY